MKMAFQETLFFFKTQQIKTQFLITHQFYNKEQRWKRKPLCLGLISTTDVFPNLGSALFCQDRVLLIYFCLSWMHFAWRQQWINKCCSCNEGYYSSEHRICDLWHFNLSLDLQNIICVCVCVSKIINIMMNMCHLSLVWMHIFRTKHSQFRDADVMCLISCSAVFKAGITITVAHI